MHHRVILLAVLLASPAVVSQAARSEPAPGAPVVTSSPARAPVEAKAPARANAPAKINTPAQVGVPVDAADAIEAGLKKGDPPMPLLDQAKALAEKEPGNARAHFLLAETLQRAGLYELAADQYLASKNMDEPAARARLERFRATMSGADLEPVMKQYLEMSTTFPQDKAVVQLQNLLKTRWGNVENAWELYLQVVAHHKRLKGINATRAWELYVARDYASALKYAESDLAIDPADPEFQALHGRVLLNMRDYAGARVPLQKAFRKSPYQYNVSRDLTKVYMALGMNLLALKTSLFYLTEKPDDPTRQQLVAHLLKEQPRSAWNAAVADAQRYAMLSNHAGDFHVGYAYVLTLLGDRKAASEQFKQGATADRRSVSAQLAYAQDLQRHGSYEEALRAYDYAIVMGGNSKTIAAARDRVRDRMLIQNNDVAAQMRSALQLGRRPMRAKVNESSP